MPSPPVPVLVLRVFRGHLTLFASLSQALSSEFDEDVFERWTLQLDISEFYALLVNPLH